MATWLFFGWNSVLSIDMIVYRFKSATGSGILGYLETPEAFLLAIISVPLFFYTTYIFGFHVYVLYLGKTSYEYVCVVSLKY